MNNKIKEKVVTFTSAAFLLVMVIMCVIAYFNPVKRSDSERRDLAQFPTNITFGGILDKTVINKFEDYTVDQFPMREFFRSLKAHFQLDVFNLKENNGMVVEDGYIVKVNQSFNDKLVIATAEKLKDVYDKYLADNGGNKYVSVIPDKNYFLGRDHGYPAPDYDFMVNTIKEYLPGMTYIDIFDCLLLTDYYRTDTHWSQNKINKVVNKLAEGMGAADRLSNKYTENILENFEGVYYKQSALYPKPDTLIYLTNEILDACTVYDYETGKTTGIYDLEQFKGNDGYNMFLSGTRALLRIDNPNATTDKELIIFRDSFGSSLAPLLAEGYKSIYLIDIRYVAADYLGSLIDFSNKDVLFIYSSLVLSQNIFK